MVQTYNSARTATLVPFADRAVEHTAENAIEVASNPGIATILIDPGMSREAVSDLLDEAMADNPAKQTEFIMLTNEVEFVPAANITVMSHKLTSHFAKSLIVGKVSAKLNGAQNFEEAAKIVDEVLVQACLYGLDLDTEEGQRVEDELALTLGMRQYISALDTINARKGGINSLVGKARSLMLKESIEEALQTRLDSLKRTVKANYSQGKTSILLVDTALQSKVEQALSGLREEL